MQPHFKEKGCDTKDLTKFATFIERSLLDLPTIDKPPYQEACPGDSKEELSAVHLDREE